MDENDSPTLIDDIKYADPTKQHPRDVLIFKNFLDEDVLSTHRHRTLFLRALDFEECGIPPPRVPCLDRAIS